MNRAERRKNELRERILAAAFELFLSQGVSATRIDEICERADIASRTFFNHFPTRQDMVRALAESRLVNLHDVVFARSDEPSRSGSSAYSTTSQRRWSIPARPTAR